MSKRFKYQSEEEYEYENEVLKKQVRDLGRGVIGHRIVKVEAGGSPEGERTSGLTLTLDTGRKVYLNETEECCAYGEISGFTRHADLIDHVITGVSADGDFERWHIYADLGDVLDLSLDWSSGNTGYYGFGLEIFVKDVEDD